MGENELQHSIYQTPSFTGGCLEIRLFYVRIAPCAADSLPDHLTLYHLRREWSVFLEINGERIPPSDAVSVTLRRDRFDQSCSDVTYVSTDSVKLSGPVEFEVYEECKDMDLILCGVLHRADAEAASRNGGPQENNTKTGWNIDCYVANTIITNGRSAFFQPKIGISSPLIEVYVAGCCSRMPVILTKTILVSPRRKASRKGMLDAIPEDEETGKEQNSSTNGLVWQQKLQLPEFQLFYSSWRQVWRPVSRIGKLCTTITRKTCTLVTMASFHGSMLVCALGWELDLGCALVLVCLCDHIRPQLGVSEEGSSNFTVHTDKYTMMVYLRWKKYASFLDNQRREYTMMLMLLYAVSCASEKALFIGDPGLCVSSHKALLT